MLIVGACGKCRKNDAYDMLTAYSSALHFFVWVLLFWHHYWGVDELHCKNPVPCIPTLVARDWIGCGGVTSVSPLGFISLLLLQHSWGSTGACAGPILFSGIAPSIQLGSKLSMNRISPVLCCCSTAGIQTSLLWLCSTFTDSMKA